MLISSYPEKEIRYMIPFRFRCKLKCTGMYNLEFSVSIISQHVNLSRLKVESILLGQKKNLYKLFLAFETMFRLVWFSNSPEYCTQYFKSQSQDTQQVLMLWNCLSQGKTFDFSSYSASEGIWEDFWLACHTFFPSESGEDEARLVSISNKYVSYSSQKEHISSKLFSG